MALIIVEAAVAAQHAEHPDAARDKEKICADYNKNNGEQEQHGRIERVARCKCYGIARAETQDTENEQHHTEPRLLFARAATRKQLDGAQHRYPNAVDDVCQQLECGKEKHRDEYRFRNDVVKAVYHVDLQDTADYERAELVHQYAEADTDNIRAERLIQRLKEQHAADMAFLHAENVVQTALALSLLHYKAVRIQHEYYRDNGKHIDADAHEGGNVAPAPYRIVFIAVKGKRPNDIENRKQSRAGKYARQIEAAILTEIGQRHARIESALHSASPPLRSMVSVSEIF